jgi:hypothetical protein
VSVRKYGPDETWPSHDKKHWRGPLAEARLAGWTLTYVNAPHRFGIVSCPAGEHTFEVDKTAKGSETKAREARKKIRWCEHPPVGSVKGQRDKSKNRLDIADDLATEVEQELPDAQAKQSAQEAIDRLEVQLATATYNVDEVLRAVQDAALEAAIDVDGAPDPPALEAKLDDANAALTDGESTARSLGRGHPGVARPLLERARNLHERIEVLRSRLTALQQRNRPPSGNPVGTYQQTGMLEAEP